MDAPTLPGLAGFGHPCYHATRHLAPAARQQQLALQAWWRAVRAVPTRVHDAGVAQAKLDWWQQQLGRLQQGARPDHPLLVALQPALAPAQLALLRQAVVAVGDGMRQNRWLDQAALEHQLDASSGRVARVAAALLGAESAPAQDWAAAVGVALARVRLLRDLGAALRRGELPLPIDVLTAHQVPARALLDLQDSPAVRALLRAQLTLLRVRLQQLRRDRPPGLSAAARPALASLRMAAALLDELSGDDVDLLHQRVQLPPSRLLWAALLSRWNP